MKRYRFLSGFLSLLLALSIIGAVGVATAFAAPEDAQAEEQEAAAEEQQPQEQQPQEQEQQAQEQQQEHQQEQPQDQQQSQEEEQEPQQNEWYDYIYSYEDATSAYEEPEHLGELPAVTPQQVVEATAVPMPAVAVSDASLFSGIVMWLCVALGIAVVVGVLVSKRTRRRGV